MSWQKNNDVNLRWEGVEKEVLPLIKKLTSDFVRCAPYGSLEFDDLLQEGKIALLERLDKYDENRQSFPAFVYVVLKNFFITEIKRITRKSRMARRAVFDGDTWKLVPCLPLLRCSFEEIPCPKTSGEAERESSRKLLNEFEREFRESLSAKHLDVFKQMIALEGPEITEISRILGESRTKVVWSNLRVKTLFTELAKKEKYCDLFGNIIKTNLWPLFHKGCKNRFDKEFAKDIIKNRSLDSHCLSMVIHQNKSKTHKRVLKRYSWGVVLFLRRNRKRSTFVVEGNFHVENGLTIGKLGTISRIPYIAYEKFNEELYA